MMMNACGSVAEMKEWNVGMLCTAMVEMEVLELMECTAKDIGKV